MKQKHRTKWWERILFSVLGFVSWLLVALVFCTYRVTVYGRDIEERYYRDNVGRGLLLASWHRGLFFFCYFYRHLQHIVMLSASKDGDLFVKAVERFGWIAVRGSSRRRGSEALREMQNYFNNGHSGGLVVDAPTGPAYISKIGIIVLAKRTGLPIVPVMFAAERYWRLRNWDGSIIPKPFSRLAYLYPDQFMYVPADATREECELKRQELDHLLKKMMYQTDHFYTTKGITDPRQIVVPENIDTLYGNTEK